jgi:hypothetical protein
MATMNRSATEHDTPRAVISTRNNSSGVFALLQWRTAAPSVATDRVGNDNAIAATITQSDSVKKAHLRRRVIRVVLATWNYARASTTVRLAAPGAQRSPASGKFPGRADLR